jgi:phosphopantothenoylcysteine decarboxylase/phosphopantothenate--cysteine ligase
MWGSPVVQQNVENLKNAGYKLMEPASGDLACGTEGKGRLPTIEEIIEEMEDIFTEKDLTDERILVTAGPTTEFIDPVRCITNRSSGKMGYAIAKIARRRGAEVVLITGPTNVELPRADIPRIGVTTACEMKDAVMANYEKASVIIKTAAVADFKCKDENCQKIKKKGDSDYMVLELEKNPDIIAELGKIKGDRIVVGFAAETENLLGHAQEKLKKKNLDLIVANNVSKAGIGFGSDDNEVTIIERSGSTKKVPRMSKDEVASIILDTVRKVIKKRKKVKDDWY